MVEPETEDLSGPRVLLFIIPDGHMLNQETKTRRRMMRRKRRKREEWKEEGRRGRERDN